MNKLLNILFRRLSKHISFLQPLLLIISVLVASFFLASSLEAQTVTITSPTVEDYYDTVAEYVTLSGTVADANEGDSVSIVFGPDRDPEHYVRVDADSEWTFSEIELDYDENEEITAELRDGGEGADILDTDVLTIRRHSFEFYDVMDGNCPDRDNYLHRIILVLGEASHSDSSDSVQITVNNQETVDDDSDSIFSDTVTVNVFEPGIPVDLPSDTPVASDTFYFNATLLADGGPEVLAESDTFIVRREKSIDVTDLGGENIVAGETLDVGAGDQNTLGGTAAFLTNPDDTMEIRVYQDNERIDRYPGLDPETNWDKDIEIVPGLQEIVVRLYEGDDWISPMPETPVIDDTASFNVRGHDIGIDTPVDGDTTGAHSITVEGRSDGSLEGEYVTIVVESGSDSEIFETHVTGSDANDTFVTDVDLFLGSVDNDAENVLQARVHSEETLDDNIIDKSDTVVIEQLVDIESDTFTPGRRFEAPDTVTVEGRSIGANSITVYDPVAEETITRDTAPVDAVWDTWVVELPELGIGENRYELILHECIGEDSRRIDDDELLFYGFDVGIDSPLETTAGLSDVVSGDSTTAPRVLVEGEWKGDIGGFPDLPGKMTLHVSGVLSGEADTHLIELDSSEPDLVQPYERSIPLYPGDTNLITARIHDTSPTSRIVTRSDTFELYRQRIVDITAPRSGLDTGATHIDVAGTAAGANVVGDSVSLHPPAGTTMSGTVAADSSWQIQDVPLDTGLQDLKVELHYGGTGEPVAASASIEVRRHSISLDTPVYDQKGDPVENYGYTQATGVDLSGTSAGSAGGDTVSVLVEGEESGDTDIFATAVTGDHADGEDTYSLPVHLFAGDTNELRVRVHEGDSTTTVVDESDSFVVRRGPKITLYLKEDTAAFKTTTISGTAPGAADGDSVEVIIKDTTNVVISQFETSVTGETWSVDAEFTTGPQVVRVDLFEGEIDWDNHIYRDTAPVRGHAPAIEPSLYGVVFGDEIVTVDQSGDSTTATKLQVIAPAPGSDTGQPVSVEVAATEKGDTREVISEVKTGGDPIISEEVTLFRGDTNTITVSILDESGEYVAASDSFVVRQWDVSDTVEFRVIDKRTSELLVGATVELWSADYPRRADETDEDGTVEFELPKENHQYEVTLDGFASKSGEIVPEEIDEKVVELVDAPEEGLRNFVAGPNPYRAYEEERDIRFQFERTASSSFELEIYTVSGQLVYEQSYTCGNLGEAGDKHYISWPGTNNEGDDVARGYYLYIFTDDSGDEKTGRLAIIR